MQQILVRPGVGLVIRPTLPPSRWRGLGAGPSNLQTGEAAAGIAVSTYGASIASAAAATTAGAIIPFVGPAIAAAGLIIEAIMNSGCGQTCILATNFANQANSALQQNIEAFFQPRTAGGGYDASIPLTTESQTAALQNFDQFWAWLVQQCSNSQLGDAGARCISDRQAGGCTWKQPASSVPPWGTPAAGACWNWFNGYRDPIQNASNVVPGASLQTDTASTTVPAAAQGAQGEAAPSSSSLLLWGGAALVLFGMLSGRSH